jgi:hypothetical protein
MHDVADTHDTLVNALSASPVAPDVVWVVHVAPSADAAHSAPAATIAASIPITRIVTAVSHTFETTNPDSHPSWECARLVVTFTRPTAPW